ncbi:hypothetical protein [Saccharopolyspora shandongensis]|uniref:hypothetical protein n=1 Tax=Saccharopolyspora shandongensis TaxID=418495 RepID=UPI000B84F19E|nr:hypothetical protein [Saccharopolyspora shandongensis]
MTRGGDDVHRRQVEAGQRRQGAQHVDVDRVGGPGQFQVPAQRIPGQAGEVDALGLDRRAIRWR